MVEQIIYNYLTDTLTVPVYTTQPDDAPPRYVLFEKTGGGLENRVNAATVAVQSYGPSLYDAAVLNETVKQAMDGLVALPEIGRCSLDTDYNFTDTERKRYRYQAVYDIMFY